MKEDPETLGEHTTFQVPGGTQALRRSQAVPVSLDGDVVVSIRRPSLLGAILIKARVVPTQRDKFESDREDLIRLLSFVADPRALANEGGLRRTEKKWLRKAEGLLRFDDSGLEELFSVETLGRSQQALALLIAP